MLSTHMPFFDNNTIQEVNMSITTLFLTIVVGLLAVLHNVDAGCPSSFTSFEGYCYNLQGRYVL